MKDKPLEIIGPGFHVCDMHYGTFSRHPDLTKPDSTFEILNPVEWLFSPEHVTGAFLQPRNAFLHMLDAVCKAAGKTCYTNKFLIVIGAPTIASESGYGEPSGRCDWWPAAYSYDGTRGGVCLVRVRQ